MVSRGKFHRLGGLVLAACVSGCGGESESSDDAGLDAAESVDAYVRGDAGRDAAPDPPLVPEQVCPGSGCATNEGALEAGAAAFSITPEPGTFDVILGPDGLPDDDSDYEPTRGDTIEDTNGNGIADPAWIAGFGMGRGANAVANDQWARALALRNGDTTIVFCSIDTVGYFIGEMDAIRERVRDELGVDYVVVSATHVHEARDTVGIWGPDLSATGRDEAYMEYVRTQATAAIEQAVERLEPAHVEVASFFLRDVDQDPDVDGVQPEVRRLVGDSRDPFVLDDQVRLMRFVAVDGSAPGVPGTPRESEGPSTDTIGTLFNFAAHPEYTGSDNRALSSDIGHWMRITLERGGVSPLRGGVDAEGIGGITLFVNGAQGVQIGPNRLELRDRDGNAVPEDEPVTAEHVGTQLGYWASRALDMSSGFGRSEILEDAPLSFRRARFTVRVQNTAYHIAFRSGLFDRELENYDPRLRIDFARDFNIPSITTELAVLRVGPAQMFTMPGELDPLLFVGTRGDRAYTPPSYNGGVSIDGTATNAPELPAEEIDTVLSIADDDARAADQVWIFGLTNDFLGYFVPPFDYELSDGAPFIVEAEGRHYEETNSIGPEGWPRVWSKLRELVAYEP